MPSGKRQLRSASSDARSTQSPLASGTYIKKETPGGLQSELKIVIFMLCLMALTVIFSFKNEEREIVW